MLQQVKEAQQDSFRRSPARHPKLTVLEALHSGIPEHLVFVLQAGKPLTQQQNRFSRFRQMAHYSSRTFNLPPIYPGRSVLLPTTTQEHDRTDGYCEPERR